MDPVKLMETLRILRESGQGDVTTRHRAYLTQVPDAALDIPMINVKEMRDGHAAEKRGELKAAIFVGG